MITNIQISNFKSLEKISLPITHLNCITGVNGMGKSTLIQTLLLLRQAYVPHGIGRGVQLKGELTGNLGEFKDVLSRHADKNEISFVIEFDTKEYSWIFEKGSINDLLQGVFPIDIPDKTALFSESNFQYIGASRISPSSLFSKSGENLEFKQFGNNGEFAIQYLYEKGAEEMAIVADVFDKHTGKELPLINQVNYWIKNITPNIELDIRLKSNTEYELRYKHLDNLNIFTSFSANNSPFGLTFALPIVTALLAAKKGDLIILENPESDLHPRAQSMLGQLIARVAAAEVQIIVETHSDHIINGICVAIHKGILKNDLTNFFYFSKPESSLISKIYSIPVKPNGRIDNKHLRDSGIDGFFDQANKDYETILFSNKQ